MSRLHPISGIENPQRQADVIFLHGLGGDAFGTWRHGKDESTSWPHWLGKEFPQVGVWSLGYAASPTVRGSWPQKLWARVSGKNGRDIGQTMPLPDRAAQVLDRLQQLRLGERPVLWICHSLGGLLAKQILRTAKDSDDSRKQAIFTMSRGVLFLGTPHAGASVASLATSFQKIFGTTITMSELQAHDAHLRELLNWYRRHSSDHIQTRTYFESRDVLGVRIVDPTTAHPGVGTDPIGLDEDHLSIAKPRTRDAQVCFAANELLREFVLIPQEGLDETGERGGVGSPVLRPTAEGLTPPRSAEPVVDANEVGHPVAPRTSTSTSTRAVPVVVNVQVHQATSEHVPQQNDAPLRAPSVPCQLPKGAAIEFVGRAAPLQQLTQRLMSGQDSYVVGPGGYGKTALAAEALQAVVGRQGERLEQSPFPDGIVLLDLYGLQVESDFESAWNELARQLRGADFMSNAPAEERAAAACAGRRALVIIEGAELAGGQLGLQKLLAVLDGADSVQGANRRLVLTRDSTQTSPLRTVKLDERLPAEEASELLDVLLKDVVEHGAATLDARQRVDLLGQLAGHPLAITWAAGLMARGDEDVSQLLADWGLIHS